MPQCTATAKSTGQQCRRWARNGYAVCPMHGAGTKKRPGGRPMVHGRYSKLGPEFQEKMARWQAMKARESLHNAIRQTLFANLRPIGLALDVLMECEEAFDANPDVVQGRATIDAAGEVLRHLGKLATRLTSTVVEWLDSYQDPVTRSVASALERSKPGAPDRMRPE